MYNGGATAKLASFKVLLRERELFRAYTELGATAQDIVDGNIPSGYLDSEITTQEINHA